MNGMNGKILYVEDDASKARESFLDDGILSGLIDNNLKEQIDGFSSPSTNTRKRSKLAATIVQPSQSSISAKDLKNIVDKDPRIVYHYDFIEALKFICEHYDKIELCILDRNLQCEETEENIKKEIEALGLKFTKNDYNFIAPPNKEGKTRNPDHHREGNYLLEKLHEKAGDDILDKIYFLSGYQEDLGNDRHHAFILQKFDKEKHYIGKSDTKKIKKYKDTFQEITNLKNYDIISKYFPDIFDVIDDKELRNYLDKVISVYEKNQSDIKIDCIEFVGKIRQIIEKIHSYIINPSRKGLKPYIQVDNPEKIRRIFDEKIRNDYRIIESCKKNKQPYFITVEHNDLDSLQSNSTKCIIFKMEDQKTDYMRFPLSILDSAYTICCEYLHTNSSVPTIKEQTKFLKQNLDENFICKYVYESVKIFFIWLKYFR